MARIEPRHYKIGNWEIRPNICTAVGDKIEMHRHNHDHLTLCWRGRFRYRNGNEVGEIASVSLGAGVNESRLLIRADAEHEFEVLELEGGTAVLECLWPEGIS